VRGIGENEGLSSIFEEVITLIEDQVSAGLGGQALPTNITSLINQIKQTGQAPFNLANPTSGQSIPGALVSGGTDVPMIPIGSSNVRGAGVFKNELIVQFHTDGPQKTYRYQFASPSKAFNAWQSLVDANSAGRWIWKEMRGKQLGPVWPGNNPKIKTPGGTSASIVPYDVSGRTPLSKVANFDKLTEQMRKFKIETKKPPTSAEPFTLEEIRQTQRKTAFKELSKGLPRFVSLEGIKRQLKRFLP